ncbi:hypothetical protein [Kaistella sp.]|uniref:hypothetical protein n=1 Tax=Kaistella sp. TaxID=2782235 RepID=UPI003C354F9C
MKKLILSAAFAVIGTFAMAQQTQKMQKMDPAQKEQKRMDRLKMMQSDLNLTDAQVDQIKLIQDQKMAEMEKSAPQRKAKMEQRKMEQNEYNKEMKQILTPDQYQKWYAKRQMQMQKRGKMMKAK